MSIAEKRSIHLAQRWEKLTRKATLKMRPKVVRECWNHDSQYIVDLTNSHETSTWLRVEFHGSSNVIISMYEQAQLDFLWPYLKALHEVAGKYCEVGRDS